MKYLLAFALWFETPNWGADSLNCAIENNVVQNIKWARLYRNLCGGGGLPSFWRQKVTVSGVSDSFEVDSTQCATYWVSTVNVRDLESCLGDPVTVRFPPTGVASGQTSHDDLPLYDLTGRRVRRPLPAGVYFTKRGRLVVLSPRASP